MQIPGPRGVAMTIAAVVFACFNTLLLVIFMLACGPDLDLRLIAGMATASLCAAFFGGYVYEKLAVKSALSLLRSALENVGTKLVCMYSGQPESPLPPNPFNTEAERLLLSVLSRQVNDFGNAINRGPPAASTAAHTTPKNPTG